MKDSLLFKLVFIVIIITVFGCSQENDGEEWREAEYQTHSSQIVTRSLDYPNGDPIEETMRVREAENLLITWNDSNITFKVSVSWRETSTDSMSQEDITQCTLSDIIDNIGDRRIVVDCVSASWQNKSAIRISVTYSIYYPLENPMNGEITWVLTPTSHDLQSSHSYSILSFLYNI